MAELRKFEFKDVVYQLLLLLERDEYLNGEEDGKPGKRKKLSDGAVRVGTRIFGTHTVRKTARAQISFCQLAKELGRSTKTIQRAIKELELAGWIALDRGNGFGHHTVIRPTDKAILLASELRNKMDKNVTLVVIEGGQKSPTTVTNMSARRGQKCPTLKTNKNLKIGRDTASLQNIVPIPLSFTQTLGDGEKGCIALWERWLTNQKLPDLKSLNLEDKTGSRLVYRVPGQTPPCQRDKNYEHIVQQLRDRALRVWQAEEQNLAQRVGS